MGQALRCQWCGRLLLSERSTTYDPCCGAKCYGDWLRSGTRKKCKNCQAPVFVPNNTGVTACVNCGTLSGNYCPDCNIPMPKPTAFCSGCGKSDADCTRQRFALAGWNRKGLLFIAITMGVLSIPLWLISKANREANRESEASKKKEDIIYRQYIDTYIRSRLPAGATLFYGVHLNQIYIQFDRPVAEYDAERLAAEVLEMMPNKKGFVRVWDDVGIQRGFRWRV